MAAKFRSEDEPFASHCINQPAGQKTALNGSHRHAQLTAEIGRCLRTRSQAWLFEPLPRELAALIRCLEERDQALSPSGQDHA
jgi:hypothetical protein